MVKFYNGFTRVTKSENFTAYFTRSDKAIYSSIYYYYRKCRNFDLFQKVQHDCTTWQMVKDLQYIGRHIWHTRDQADHNQYNILMLTQFRHTSGNQEILAGMQNFVLMALTTM